MLILGLYPILQFADPITQTMVDNNLIGYSMQGIIQTDGHSDNIIVENNLVVSDHYHGITLPGAVNCRVQNNTVMKTPTSVNPATDAHPWIRFSKDKQGNYAHDCIMRNNISTFKTEGVYWEFDENPTSGYGRNNLRENNNTFEESEYSSLFVNYSGFDFHIVDGSIAIDAGVNTDLTSTDIEGNIRMVGSAVDVGCYEVQADRDDNPPTISKADDTYFDDEVVVVFSESVTKSTAELVDNYFIDGGVNIVEAELSADAVTVTLTTTQLNGNVEYTVTASNVEDFAGNKANNTSAKFTYLCNIVSASSYQDDQWGTNPPTGAFDGDMNTKWSAEGNGEWIMKNFCSIQLISSVSIAFGYGDTRIYDFSIETSLDGINFTEAYRGSSSHTLELQTFIFSGVSGKYLRIVGRGNDTNLWNNYVEISIETSEVPNDPNLEETDFASSSFVVYPNPVIGKSFSIEIASDVKVETVNIKLFQLNGVEVQKTTSKSDDKFVITLSENISSGIYILIIGNNDFSVQKKIFVK
jgi:parallel beta-helix repeat protein